MIYGPEPFVSIVEDRPVFTKEIQDKYEGRKRRHITKAIIHCSDSLWGDFKAIDSWHSERWSGIVSAGKRIYCGYHYIILNGHCEYKSKYTRAFDGKIQKGRPDFFIGAHCRGKNLHSIGICLIGKTGFTDNQYQALSNLLTRLFERRDLTVHAHNEFSTKTCPNFDIKAFKAKWLANYWD
jgi:N-acetylmuramoyl-L-alanine amidase